MLAPALTLTTDTNRLVACVEVRGPLATADHADSFRAACEMAPQSMSLVVTLTGLTSLTATGIECLRDLARACSAAGQTLVFVCADLLMRRELVLADLDTLAPVVHASEQALALAA